MNLPHFLVISLQRSEVRRQSIERQMQDLGFEFTFIDAVDGKKLDEYNIPTDKSYFPEKVGSVLTPGEIACAESHVLAYKYMLKKGFEHAVILEDDVVFSDDFKELIINIMQTIKDRHELIYLGHGKAKSWPFSKKITKKYNLEHYIAQSRNSTRLIVCAAAYMINNNAAKRLVEIAYPIRLPADYLLGLIPNHGLATYGIEPQCIGFLDVESEIDSVQDRYN